jgi:molybdopterin-guanine dinucleotide biosynthesis protein A
VVIHYNRTSMKLTVAIQAGGESRRMGRDKGLVPFLGKTLVERVLQRLQPIADELIVTTNDPSAYEFLSLPLYSDLIPGAGALGGLYTALHAAGRPCVAVVACDMPFTSPKLLHAACKRLIEGQYDLVVPRSLDGLEPFHAVYRRATCLPHILNALQAGKRRVDSWFHAVRISQMAWDEVLQIDPTGRAFLNANTPEELVEAERIALEEGS